MLNKTMFATVVAMMIAGFTIGARAQYSHDIITKSRLGIMIVVDGQLAFTGKKTEDTDTCQKHAKQMRQLTEKPETKAQADKQQDMLSFLVKSGLWHPGQQVGILAVCKPLPPEIDV